jgi:hypothetical protein
VDCGLWIVDFELIRATDKNSKSQAPSPKIAIPKSEIRNRKSFSPLHTRFSFEGKKITTFVNQAG